MACSSVKALAFDVFGTVVDVRGTLIRELQAFARSRAIAADWARFADQWIDGYVQGVASAGGDCSPWREVDSINRETLERLILTFDLSAVSEADQGRLNLIWHRLQPWPDVVPGLQRLRTRFKVVTLANANVSLLADIAANAWLPWDEILSAQFVEKYKPDPAVYQMAVDRLHLQPDEIMMVAAHQYDLNAAQLARFKTAFIWRPLESGPDGQPDFPKLDDPYDVVVGSLTDLAAKLGV